MCLSRSFVLAIIATLICVLLGYPVAYFLPGRGQACAGWP